MPSYCGRAHVTLATASASRQLRARRSCGKEPRTECAATQLSAMLLRVELDDKGQAVVVGTLEQRAESEGEPTVTAPLESVRLRDRDPRAIAQAHLPFNHHLGASAGCMYHECRGAPGRTHFFSYSTLFFFEAVPHFCGCRAEPTFVNEPAYYLVGAAANRPRPTTASSLRNTCGRYT